MQEYLKDPDIIRVEFDRIIEIMQFGITELNSVVAARYNGSMLIPNRKFRHEIKLGDKAFIIRPGSHFETVATYYKNFQRVDIYAVNILPVNILPTEIMVETETGKDIELFENIFILKNLLRAPDESNIAKILIRKPNKKHNNYLILMKIEDKNIRELFQVFFEKKGYRIKLLDQEKDNGNSDNLLLEIIMDGGMEIEEVKGLIMVPFYKYFSLKSET